MVTQHISVARAVVAENVTITPEEVQPVEVHADHPFSIGLSYRLYETSPDKDSWHFSIETSIDGDTKQGNVTVADRPFLRDDQWSHVRTEHTLPAGRHTIHYTVKAALERGAWSGGTPAAVIADETHTGTVVIEARQRRS